MKTIWLLLGLSLIGCKKQLPLATLPPPAAQTAPPVHHDEKLPEPPAPQTSSLVVAPQPNIAPQPVATIPPPVPTASPKKKRPPRKPAPPVPATAKVEAAPPEVAKLRQVLTPVQEQSYNRIIDQDLQRARTNLAIASAKTLSDPQKAVVQQVRSFIKQVEDLRTTDLEEAKGLSHKADILASDLARSLP